MVFAKSWSTIGRSFCSTYSGEKPLFSAARRISDDIIGGSFFAIRGSGSEPVRYGCLAHLNAPDAGHGVRDGTDGRYTQI